MMCARMSTTYTTSYGKASDCHAGRCRDIPVSRRERSVLVAGRSMEYKGTMRFLFALWLTGLVAWLIAAQ